MSSRKTRQFCKNYPEILVDQVISWSSSQISGTGSDLVKQFRLIRPDPDPRSESTTQQSRARKPSTRFECYLCFNVEGKFGTGTCHATWLRNKQVRHTILVLSRYLIFLLLIVVPYPACLTPDLKMSAATDDAEITTAVSFDVSEADNLSAGPRVADASGDVVRDGTVAENGRESVGSTLTAVGWAADGPGISALLAGLTASAGHSDFKRLSTGTRL
jgi:hypothetical protein